MAKNRYTQEFNDEAAKLVLRDGRTFREVSASLGVDQGSLRQWVRFARAAGVAAAPATDADLARRIRELEAQVQRLQTEKEILKKAAAYFAREGGA